MRPRRRLGSSPGGQYLPGSHWAKPQCLGGPCLACLFHRGHLKAAKDPRRTWIGCQVFRKTLRQPGEKDCEAEEEAGVLPPRVVPCRQPLHWA